MILHALIAISSYEEAMLLFQQAIELAQITQSSETAWATTYVNLGTCYRKLKCGLLICSMRSQLTVRRYRRYPEAKATYQKVIQLDPRNAAALGFLGMVHHLMYELDAAIVKYHEVRAWAWLSVTFN